MDSLEQLIQGKKVLIFGLGRQGGGSGDRDWLLSHGAQVRVSDKDLSLCSEGQTQEQIEWSEIIIKNPGVSDDHELIKYALSLGKPVFTSIALFVKYAPIQTIAVTGTRGKSTTVALISQLLNSAYPNSVITGGNIPGTSGLGLFAQLGGKKFAILELSSFQLHNFHDLNISPHIAILTNIYPDHLNRYSSMDEYMHDKSSICRYQRANDCCLYNLANAGAVKLGNLSPGYKIGYSATELPDLITKLPGAHNRENLAAMFKLGEILNIDRELCLEVAANFSGLPYRQEVIKVQGGVKYINDTTSTTPIAAVKALQAATGPTIWITGGDTKNLPFDILLEEVMQNRNIKNVIILGSKNIPDYVTQLKHILGSKVLAQLDNMEASVRLAHQVAKKGDTVLLSPGFASFDLFQNEFDRGRQFNDCVKKLS